MKFEKSISQPELSSLKWLAIHSNLYLASFILLSGLVSFSKVSCGLSQDRYWSFKKRMLKKWVKIVQIFARWSTCPVKASTWPCRFGPERPYAKSVWKTKSSAIMACRWRHAWSTNPMAPPTPCLMVKKDKWVQSLTERFGQVHDFNRIFLTWQCIYSVGRRFVNEVLLNGKRHENVHCPWRWV